VGASAFDLIIDYEDIIDSGVILEIGSTRGDGSTQFFAGYVSHNIKFKFYTVDINTEITRHLLKFERVKYSNIKVFTGKGEDIIDQINEPISYAYLDNFDLIREESRSDPYVLELVTAYKKNFGIEMNNDNCHAAHLLQAQKVSKKAAKRCIIQLDDTHYNNGWVGKGATAVPWLLSVGWRILPQHNDIWTSTDYIALANWS
jgi:hypothetical protein